MHLRPTRSQSLTGLPLLLAMLWASSASAMPTTLVNNGPSSNRVDIVFLGDGYTHADHAAGLYDDHINAYVNYMFSQAFSDPFPRYHNFFNVHKITTNSIHSGADVPNATPPVFRVTPFNASYEVPAGETYNGSDNDRLILIDTSAADAARAAGLAGTNITADIQLMTVNSDKYGGSGGSWAVFSGPNFAASEVALHELAHSFAGLADEYGGFTTPYTGGEPSEPNVTTDPTGAKWAHWAGFDDPRGSHLDITTEEGGRYYNQGIYRPSENSKMRTVATFPSVHFDAVSREQLILSIYEHVNPLDGWRQGSHFRDDDLWIDVVDPNVIKVEWFVDKELVLGATGQTFNPRDYGFDAGTYEIYAHAYDSILDHANHGGLLDLVRTDLHEFSQMVMWDYTLSPEGDFDQNDVVDIADYELWKQKYGSPVDPWFGDGNGIVDAGDYVVWRNAYGKGPKAHLAAVPEPTSLTLMAVGVIAVGCCWWRGGSNKAKCF